MANALSEIDGDEVSLVDRGANKRRILVTKRDPMAARKAEIKKVADTLRALAGDRLELMQVHLDTIAGFETADPEALDQAFFALSDLVWDARQDIVALAAAAGATEEVVEQINEIAKQKKEAVEMAGHTDEIAKVEFTEDELVAMKAFAAGTATDDQTAMAMKLAEKAIGFGGIYPKPEPIEQQEDPDEDPEEPEIKVDKAEDDLAKRDTVTKAEFAKQALEMQEIRKELVAEQDLRKEAEHIQKCAAWPNLFDATKAGPIMKRLEDKLDADDFKWVQAQLTQSQAFAKMADAFGEVGTRGTGDNEGNPVEQLNKIAEAIVTKRATDGDPVSFSKAHTMACSQNPNLVAELRNQAREAN